MKVIAITKVQTSKGETVNRMQTMIAALNQLHELRRTGIVTAKPSEVEDGR